MEGNSQSVDKLYSMLRINENRNPIRTTINTGNLNQKLNVNFSSVVSTAGKSVWGNSVGKLK